MKKASILWMFFILSISCLFSQNIDRGPVIGGMTSQSARVYIRTTALQSFTLQVDTDSTFSNPLTFQDSTRSTRFNSVITPISGLNPDTEYFYRFLFNGNPDNRTGSFKTFPTDGTPGHFKIAVGSCNYENNFSLFTSIRNFDPDLFLHLGDWNWPPNPLGNDYNLYPDKQAESFAMRYDDNNMKQYVLPYCPIDYIYDDDFSYNDNEGWTFSTDGITPVTIDSVITNFYTDSMPAGIREGAIQAYFNYFPGYPAVDTTVGIQHSFKMGNIEFFMLDTRSSKKAKFDAFVQDSTTLLWSFAPDSNHTTLGFSQRDWLVNGLKNSTADWKIIGSSVIFNRMYGLLIQFGLQIQTTPFNIAGRAGSGGTLASSLAYNWAGYPADQDTLLDWIDRYDIEDVFLLSGDSHSSMLDDGQYAGLPEMQASGLAAGDEAFLNWYIDSVAQSIGFPPVDRLLWSGGGSGIGNTNFSDTYGTVEIWGRDSLEMCVVDELDQTLGCLLFRHSSNPVGTEAVLSRPSGMIEVAFPNPTKDKLKIHFRDDFQPQKGDEIQFVSPSGTVLKTWDASTVRSGQVTIDLKAYSAGLYLLHYKGKGGTETRKIVIN